MHHDPSDHTKKTNICFEMTTEFAAALYLKEKGNIKEIPFILFTKKLTLKRMNSNINVTIT